MKKFSALINLMIFGSCSILLCACGDGGPVTDKDEVDLPVKNIELENDTVVTFLNIDGIRNGDLNGDDRVNSADLEILAAFLEDAEDSPGVTADIDADGLIGEADLALLSNIVEGNQPHIISADWIEDEEIGTGFLEMLIMTRKPRFLLEVNGNKYELVETEEIEPGVYFANIFPEGIDTSGRGDLDLVVYSETGQSTTYSTYFINGVEAGIEFENEEEFMILFQEKGEVPTEKLKVPNDCCIKEVKLKILMPGLVYDGFSDQGIVELKGVNSTVVPVGKVGVVSLPGTAHYFTIRLYEVGKSGKKITAKSVPFFVATFNCDNLKKGIIKEVVPKSDGNSQVRARNVLEVVDFKIEKPCKKARGKIEFVNRGFLGGDNFEDSTNNRFSSGVNFKLIVDYAQLSKAGCEGACWVQYVQTIIEVKRKGQKDFKEVLGGPIHIDHSLEPLGDIWFCYPIQQSFLKPNGQLDKLEMRDYPHIKHGGVICTDKGKLKLKDGDIVRRRSVFYPQLICVDPPPFKVLASFTYTLTTEYTYNKVDLSKGGESKVSPLSPFPYTKTPTGSDKNKLKEFLKKKEKRGKNCK
ncbi:MAG: dockerin type I repeat-containing protein [Bacteroidota bacterium]